jgi:TolB protein
MKKTAALLLLSAFIVLVTTFSVIPVFSQEDSSGQIAYIGTDFNVYTIAGQGGDPVALTSDAQVTQTEAHFYQWPTWSSDGQLAYFGLRLNTEGLAETEILIAQDAQTPGVSAYVGDEGFTYAGWSPSACGEDCHDLAVLLSDPTGLLVKLFRWENGEATSTIVGRGGPFYYSFSPDGTQMILQLNNTRFDIYDTGSNSVTSTLEQLPGAMFTPGWSPVDDRLLLGVLHDASTDLVIASNGDETTLLGGHENPIWFSWSPDGTQVAYTDREGPVIVFDAATGEEVSRSPVGGALAFFWSPDSQHIAYVTLSAPSGSFDAKALTAKSAGQAQTPPTGLAWSVLDVADGANRRYGAFYPTRDQVYLLTYFDQFALSHHVWSPDSTHLVYSEVTPENDSVISVLDTTSAVSVPVIVADGYLGIWSFS